MGNASSQIVPQDGLPHELDSIASTPKLTENTTGDNPRDNDRQITSKKMAKKARQSVQDPVHHESVSAPHSVTRRKSIPSEPDGNLTTETTRKRHSDITMVANVEPTSARTTPNPGTQKLIVKHSLPESTSRKRKRHTGRPKNIEFIPPEQHEPDDGRIAHDAIAASSLYKPVSETPNLNSAKRQGYDADNSMTKDVVVKGSQPLAQSHVDFTDRNSIRKESKKRKRSSKTPSKNKDLSRSINEVGSNGDIHGDIGSALDEVVPSSHKTEERQRKKRKKKKTHPQAELPNEKPNSSTPRQQDIVLEGEEQPVRDRHVPAIHDTVVPLHTSTEDAQSPPPLPTLRDVRPSILSTVDRLASEESVSAWLNNNYGSNEIDNTQQPLGQVDVEQVQKSGKKSTTARTSKHNGTDSRGLKGKKKRSSDALAAARKATAEADLVAYRAQTELPSKGNQYTGLDKGRFTAHECAIADEVFAETCRELKIDAVDLTFCLTSWTSETSRFFANALAESLPRRSAAALRKFSQRRWHNNERGAWSAEDDARLRQAWNEQPGNWGYCSEMTNRQPADCRDRWKNYGQYEGKLELGPWTQDEEKQLLAVVESCIQELKKNKDMDPALRQDREALEKQLHWETVARKMGHTRSARRCNDKWSKLRKRAGNIWEQPRTIHNTNAGDKPISKAYSNHMRLFKKLLRGDKLRIMWDIAAVDPSGKKVWKDESTFWSIVAIKTKLQEDESKYPTAVRRFAYYEAMERYPQVLPTNGTIAANANALASHMAVEFQNDGQGLPRADPRKLHKYIKGSQMSSELVENSGDEDEGDQIDLFGGPMAPFATTQNLSSNEPDNQNANFQSEDEGATITSLASSDYDAHIAHGRLSKDAFVQRLSGADPPPRGKKKVKQPMK